MAKARATGLSPDKLREYARSGAEAALERLRAEIVAIERAFPGLVSQSGPGHRQPVTRPKRRTRRMSTAARRAVSERMKRYWANRRKAKLAK